MAETSLAPVWATDAAATLTEAVAEKLAELGIDPLIIDAASADLEQAVTEELTATLAACTFTNILAKEITQ